MNFLSQKIWHLLSVCLISLILLFIARPALHGGLFQTDDDVQVTRIMAMHEELNYGQFPVRYIDSFGNGGGYFLFNFYSPFVYYVGASLVFLGFSYLQAVKLVFLLYIFLGTIGIFMFLKSQTSWFAAIWGTCLFLLTPYVFHDLFHRGALAESAGFLISPFILWAFFNLKNNPKQWRWVIAAISFGCLVVTHILTGAMFGATLLAWLLIYRANKKEWLLSLTAIIMGLCLAGFYFFPAVLENHLVRYDQTEPVKHGYLSQFVNLSQQIGFDQAITSKKSFLGIGLLITFLCCFVINFSSKKILSNQKYLFQLISMIAGVGLFLMMDISNFVWANLSIIRFLQFPYRILTVVTVLLTLGFSLVFDFCHQKWQKILLVFVIIIFPTSWYYSYFSVKSYQYIPEYKVEGKCKTTSWEDEHFPKTVPDCMPGDYNQPLVRSLSNKVNISQIQTSNHNRRINFKVDGGNDIIEITKYYFPGWTIKNANNQELKIEPSKDYGLISINLENGYSGNLTAQLNDTKIRTWGNWSTIVSAIILMWLLFIPLPPPIRLPKSKN